MNSASMPLPSAARRSAPPAASAQADAAEAPPDADSPGSTMQVVRHAALLTRLLAELMLVNVQRTAALNVDAANRLLSHARLPRPASFDRRQAQWATTWRRFEICATTADQILELSSCHVRHNGDALWALAERILGEMAAMPPAQAQAWRDMLAQLQRTQQDYLLAWQQAQDHLLAGVQALAAPPAPAAGP